MGAALLGAALLLAGCGREPAPVLDLKISSGDWNDYHRSLQAITDRQTAGERTEFEKSLQALKYQAMTGGRVSPGEELNYVIREKITGRTVRQVLVTGQTLRLARKQEEEKALRHSIAMNRRLRTRPGDEASATFLQATHVNQARQWEVLRQEIAAIQKRLNELDPSLSKVWPEFSPLEEIEAATAKDADEKPEPGKPAGAPRNQPF